MTDEQITRIFEQHIDTVYRVCFTYFKGNAMDIDDAVQTVFLNLICSGRSFENAQHEKAWLIVAASNACKNMLKRKSRKDVSLEDWHHRGDQRADKTFGMILALPEKYKLAIYLHYYEGYSAREIGAMLGKKQSTIWKHMKVGRDMLRERIAEER